MKNIYNTNYCFREIGDLLKYIQDYPSIVPRLPRKLEVTQDDVNNLQDYLDRRLLNVWEWLLRVMDSTESQLRFGGSLTSSTDHVRPKPASAPPPGRLESRAGRERDNEIAARREFLSYSLSLMRGHNAEHLDSLPVVRLPTKIILLCSNQRKQYNSIMFSPTD